MILAEEKMRADLMSVLMYYKDDLSISSQYYIYKDVFNDLANAYEGYIKAELKKEKNESTKEEPINIDLGNININMDEIKQKEKEEEA